MKNETYSGLTGYVSAMAQAKILYSKGIITAQEYGVIETKMCEKFGINCCSLFRQNDWINTHFRVNISPTKEVL